MLEEDWGVKDDVDETGSEDGWFEVFRPIGKMLACGDIGIGWMREWTEVVSIIEGLALTLPEAIWYRFEDQHPYHPPFRQKTIQNAKRRNAVFYTLHVMATRVSTTAAEKGSASREHCRLGRGESLTRGQIQSLSEDIPGNG